MTLDRFEFYDVWLLLSIGFNKNGQTLKGIQSSSDIYNHSYLSLEELNYGISKLIHNRYVEKGTDGRYKATTKAELFYCQHEIKSEGCIATLMRLSEVFIKLDTEPNCNYFQYVTVEEYEASIPKSRLLNLIYDLLSRSR